MKLKQVMPNLILENELLKYVSAKINEIRALTKTDESDGGDKKKRRNKKWLD